MSSPPPKPQGRKYSGIAPEERARHRRASLLASALEQFGTCGYATVSIKQICQGAGLTERYFYESFTGREDCLAALYDDLAAAMRAATLTAIDSALPNIDDAAAAGLAAFIGYLSSDPRRARVVLIEVVGVSPAMEQRRHRVLRDFVDTVLAVWAAESRPPGRRQRLTATALVGGVNHLLVDWLMDECRDDPADLVTVCADLFAAARAHWDATASATRPIPDHPAAWPTTSGP